MKAGSASVDITPPVGAPMACFPVVRGEQPRRAEGVHLPLLANALVLSDGKSTVGLCSSDLSMIHHVDVEEIRSRVGEEIPELGGPPLIIAATHTHSGPENTYLFGAEPGDEMIRELNSRIAAAVVRAARSLRDATLSVAGGTLDLSHNRRVTGEDGRSRMVMEREPGTTEGPVDRDLEVLTCESAGRTLGILCNWTAHALTLGPQNRLFSPDYPGAARQEIQRLFPEAGVLFMNGAAGNVHPHRCMQNDPGLTGQIGASVGSEVLRLIEDARPVPNPELQPASHTLRFPNRMDPDREVEVEISCLRIGPVLFAFVPGEVFVEFALEFKRRVDFEHVFFVGYANGWPGYIPTRKAYETGGYGVDRREDDPPEFGRTVVPRGAGEEILEALVELARW